MYYLVGDDLGSTSLALDSARNVVSESRYFPYGEVVTVAGHSPTDYGFTGQLRDGYINLVQMGARWYDPTLMRWVSADTIVPGAGNPQALNRYSYSLSNPLKYIDPTGHVATPPCFFACSGPGTPISAGWQVNLAAFGCVFINCHVARTDNNVWGDPWGGSYEIRDNGFVLPVPMAVEAGPLESLIAEGKVAAQAPLLALDDLAGPASRQALPEANFSVGGRGVAGEFSIIDWSGYPTEGNVPRPSGPFHLAVGEEYGSARAAANTINEALHAANPSALLDMEIHEIQPVKFGGSPTNFGNKYVLPGPLHSQYTVWWNNLQRVLGR